MYRLLTYKEKRIEQVGLVIYNRTARFGVYHLPSGRQSYGVSARSVPFHRRDQSRIDIGNAFCNQTYFERTTGRSEYHLAMFAAARLYEGFRFGRQMRTRGNDCKRPVLR